jgi:hypothetical protein
MEAIRLPIYFDNDNTTKLRDCGIDYDLNKCDIKEVIFYNIDCLEPRNEGGTFIYSGGDRFLSNLGMEQLNNIILNERISKSRIIC